MRKRSKPVIGLIGGIGSGKSYVARLLAEQGAAVIEADKLGHEALRQPAIREQTFGRWGPAIRTEAGEVDRRRLGAIIFADPAERRILEGMVFPWIERRIREELEEAVLDPASAFIVLDAAILLETDWARMCDSIVFVDAPREQRHQRLFDQRGWSAKEVEAREHAQISLDEKKARADFIVDNSGDAAASRRHVERLMTDLRGRLAPKHHF